MEYNYIEPDTNPTTQVLCCSCGIPIEANPANMCVACLRTQVDISDGIPKQATIHFCRACERYLQPPADWVHCSLESRELLQLCLKKLKGLNKVKLIDAGFIWTEPHSKRIKVKVTIQGEVLGGTVLQQVFVVEYTVANQMCDDCHRVEAKDFWQAVVQVRQKAENRKTFYYLEQLILKHKAHENTVAIKPIHDGIDFYYATESHARRMVDFLNNVIPCRYQQSKKLISHDIHNSTYNYKFTFSVEIAPVSKNSVVCLSKKMAHQFGGISPVCLVLRATKNIHLIDPCTAQLAEITGTHYWRDPFHSVLNPKQLQLYSVMDVEPIRDKERKFFPGQGPISRKHLLYDVFIVKASELGTNDNTIHTRSHIGHLLKPFDLVLGYNVSECNANDENFEKVNKDLLPEVILVKKYYEFRKRKRAWKLKHLPRDDTSIGTGNQDYNEFLDDLEEDPEYRKDINIYKNEKVMPVDVDDMEDPSQPRITLEEMLDDLNIEE